MIRREIAEQIYRSLDNEGKHLAGVFGCMAAMVFNKSLMSMLLRTFSEISDNDKLNKIESE